MDIEIRARNREAIEAHLLFPLITLIEGDSTDPGTVEQVKAGIGPGETVPVLLDSNHTREHVLAELNAYAPLVTEGSYMVAMDGIMEQVVDAPHPTGLGVEQPLQNRAGVRGEEPDSPRSRSTRATSPGGRPTGRAVL